jgi:hypothetical protein
MKKIELKTRKLLRMIFGGITLTAVAFVFQACYGPPRDRYYDVKDVKLTGKVTSKTTNLPIKGIKVTVNDWYNYGITDENGNFDFYAEIPNWVYYRDNVHYTPDSIRVHFLDIDSIENGYFADKTIIVDPEMREIELNVELEEKNE